MQVKPHKRKATQSSKERTEVARSASKSNQMNLTCEVCGDEYQVRPSRASNSKYCSAECTGEAQKRRVKKSCERCGQPYEVPRSKRGRRFCSRACAAAAGAMGPSGESLTLNCQVCESAFEVPPSKRGQKYCSRECAGKGEKKINVECEICSDEFEVQEHREESARFCSSDCKNEWQTKRFAGEGNPSWLGGQPEYYGASWLRQRRKTLERDDYQCTMCGLDEEGHRKLAGRELHVHHKIPFRVFDSHEEANRLGNLMTVCQSCHHQLEPVSRRLGAEMEGAVE